MKLVKALVLVALAACSSARAANSPPTISDKPPSEEALRPRDGTCEISDDYYCYNYDDKGRCASAEACKIKVCCYSGACDWTWTSMCVSTGWKP